jgi:hypothetical protein
MSSLSLALYCEGATDRNFLPTIIQRTAQDILNKRARRYVEVLAVDVVAGINKQKNGQDILEAATQMYGYHALVIHKDTDSRTYKATREQSFEPGYLLAKKNHHMACEHLIPIIPIREVEAWMLADHEVLRKVLELQEQQVQNLHLKKRAALVETYPDPKNTFNEVVKRAEKDRRLKINRASLYTALAEEIRLERLGQVPAYQSFIEELSSLFIELHFIPSE